MSDTTILACIFFTQISITYITLLCLCLFFFNDTATTEIYTLSLHDALPIWQDRAAREQQQPRTNRHRVLACHCRSEEHTSELQSHSDLVCRLLLEKKKKKTTARLHTAHEESKEK